MLEIFLLLVSCMALAAALSAHFRAFKIEEEVETDLDTYLQQLLDNNSRLHYLETLLKEEKVNHGNTTIENITTTSKIRRKATGQKRNGGSKISKT